MYFIDDVVENSRSEGRRLYLRTEAFSSEIPGNKYTLMSKSRILIVEIVSSYNNIY